MGYTIASAVSEILGEMQFLRSAFQYELVNYSALARMIQPLVVEKTGGEAGLDAIIMGIRRYSTNLSKEVGESDVNVILKDCSLTLRTDLVAVYYKYWRTVPFLDRLRAMQMEQVDWNAGEKVYIIQRSGEMAIIANTKFLPEILELGRGSQMTKLLATHDGLAVLTVSYPARGVEMPGLFAYLGQRLASAGVNSLAVFSTYRKISFLIEERHIGRAYELVSTAIASSRKLQKALASESVARR